MKPSNSPDTIAVLDSEVEVKIVLDALDDNTLRTDPVETWDEFANSFGVRFRNATTRDVTIRPDQYREPVIKDGVEFSVGASDRDFVLVAAQRIVEQNRANFSSRLINRITGRTRAARAMISALHPE